MIIPSRILNPVAYNGALGVCMFFVISGYLITSLTLQRDGGCRVMADAFTFFAPRAFCRPLLLIAVNLACNGLGLDGLVSAESDLAACSDTCSRFASICFT